MDTVPAETSLNFLKYFASLTHHQINIIEHMYLSQRKMRIYDRRMLYERILSIKNEFGLSNKHVKVLSKYFAILKRMEISRGNDLELGSIVAMNRRLDRMFAYMPKLSVDYEEMLTSSPSPGFLLLRSKNLPRTLFVRLRAKYKMVKVGENDGINSVYGYLRDGYIVTADRDVDIACEKYSYDVGSYPSVVTYLNDLLEPGNFLTRKFINLPSMQSDPIGYYYELSRHMYDDTKSQVVEFNLDSKEESDKVIEDKFVIDVEFWQGKRHLTTKLISRLKINLSSYISSVNDVSDMVFEFSASCLDDESVKDNFGNLLFRSDLYFLESRLSIETNLPFKLRFRIIDRFVGYNYGLASSSRDSILSLIDSPSYFISVIGPKGSGKSKFLKLYSEKHGDVLTVDSDVYGCYVFDLVRRYYKNDDDLDNIKGLILEATTDDFLNSIKNVFEWQTEKGDLDEMTSVFTLKMAHDLNYSPAGIDIGLNFINWCASLFDDKYLGLIRFQNTLIQYARGMSFSKILYFGHTSLENYYLNVDTTVTVSPNFFEPIILLSRERINEDIKPLINEDVTLSLIELGLYTVYNKYIDRVNSTGWLGIYELFGLDVVTDVTIYCVNQAYKDHGLSDDEIADERIFSVPVYKCSRPIYADDKLYGAKLIIMPIGHGKTYYSKQNTAVVQIDDIFSDNQLIKLYHSPYHFATLDYLIQVCDTMIERLKQAVNSYRAILIHNSSVSLAFGRLATAFVLTKRSAELYDVLYNEDGNRMHNVKLSVDHVRNDEYSPEIFEYDDLVALHQGVDRVLTGD